MSDRISFLLVIIPLLPLLAGVVTAILGPTVLKKHSNWPLLVAVPLSFLASAVLLVDVAHMQGEGDQAQAGQHTVTLWTWADVSGAYLQPPSLQGESTVVTGGLRDFKVDITLRADALTAIMLCMVTFVSSLVIAFAAAYMDGDRGYWRFFTYIGLFVFSMTMLVSVSNFILLFVFWEAVGACSYLLIGFWYTKGEAAAAGKKAFLVNRVGDFGFALAIFLIWTTYGTINFHDTASPESATEAASVVTGVLSPARITSGALVGGIVGFSICVLLMLGACGKSAQFPLHVWLPDAMEGPTPVSALIHAATMVTAGVYMVLRCFPLFSVSPDAQLIVACIGGFTALMAGLIALTQFDLKRVLAYSTISQLGYMFLALGTGSVAGLVAGMFHLFTHAFFKALLFLGSGSVMHAMGNVIDMRRFGGLRKIMPWTYITFLIGSLALAGFPLLSGFYSKDAILAAVHERSVHLQHPQDHGTATLVATAAKSTVLGLSDVARGRIFQTLYLSALLTAFLTAFYTFRAFFLTFFGPLKVPTDAGDHAHESPPMMVVPLVVLAICAAGIGFFFTNLTNDLFGQYLSTTPGIALGSHGHLDDGAHQMVAIISTVLAFSGIGLAAFFYLENTREAVRLQRLFDFAWLGKLCDVESVARLRNLSIAVAIHRAAGRARLGWLASLIGFLVLTISLLLAIPLFVLYYCSPYRLSYQKFFFDEIYQVVIVGPIRILARFFATLDRLIVDGLVNTIGKVPVAVGNFLRAMQMGLVQFYALAMVLGFILLMVARLVW